MQLLLVCLLTSLHISLLFCLHIWLSADLPICSPRQVCISIYCVALFPGFCISVGTVLLVCLLICLPSGLHIFLFNLSSCLFVKSVSPVLPVPSHSGLLPSKSKSSEEERRQVLSACLLMSMSGVSAARSAARLAGAIADNETNNGG
jgi:hypothetical protein